MATSHAQPNSEAASNRHSTTPINQRPVRFIAGIVLMSMSFLVYPAYPVILIWLSISANAKIIASVAVWVLSWSAFSLGAYLAGPQGYTWFKGAWTRLPKNSRAASRKQDD
jgi:hypothetical protein